MSDHWYKIFKSTPGHTRDYLPNKLVDVLDREFPTKRYCGTFWRSCGLHKNPLVGLSQHSRDRIGMNSPGFLNRNSVSCLSDCVLDLVFRELSKCSLVPCGCQRATFL